MIVRVCKIVDESRTKLFTEAAKRVMEPKVNIMMGKTTQNVSIG
jgi:hypothetical protein